MKNILSPNANQLFSVLLALCLLGGTTGCGMIELRDTTKPAKSHSTELPKETDVPTESETVPYLPETNAPETVPVETDAPETSMSETDVVETEPSPIAVTDMGLSFHTVTLAVDSSIVPRVTLLPYDAEDQTVLLSSSDPNIAAIDENGRIRALAKGQCTVTVTSAGNPVVSDVITVAVEDAPACTTIDGVLIANKSYALPDTFAPGIDSEANNALYIMMNDAAKEGISLWVVSAYRGYWDQYVIYNNYVARDGQAEADRYSARPGHSEHQSGLAFDLNSLYQSFGETAEGIWLAANCHRYGFIIRYPKEKEHITGYMYEPWHVRYVGVDMAQKITESGLCMEEFFGITSAYGVE